MKILSATALANLRKLKHLDVSILCEGSVSNITLTNADIVAGSFSIDRNSISGESLEIGNAETSELKLTLNNNKGQFNSYIFEGAILTVTFYIGAETLAGGKFIVDEPPKKFAQITLRALDYMAKFNLPYVSDYTIRTSLGLLLAEVCTKCGVNTDITTFTNSTYETLPPSGDGLTYHQVVAWIAELSGNNAWIDTDGKLKLSWYGENQGITEFDIDPSDRFSYQMAENDITITGLVFKAADEEDHLFGTDDYALIIEENPMLAYADRVTVLTAVFNKLNGFTYRPFNFSTKGYPHLFPMDRVTVTPPTGADVVTYITNHNYKFNGKSNLVGKGESKVVTGYATAAPFTANQKRVLESVSTAITRKQVNNLQGATLALNELIANSMGYFQTNVVDGITGAITTYIHDSATLEGSQVIYVMTELGLAWTNEGWNGGSPVWNYGISSDGNAVLNTLTAYGINASLINISNFGSGQNIAKNTIFADNLVPIVGEEFASDAYENFRWGITGVKDFYGWRMNDGVVSTSFEEGWLWSSIQFSQFSYYGADVVSSSIYVAAGKVYTLSYYGWEFSDPADLCGMFIAIPKAGAGTDYDLYNIFKAPIVAGDPAWKVSSVVGERVPDFSVPIRTGDVPPYAYDTLDFVNFTPTRFIVTFTLPAVINGNKLFIALLDHRTSSVSTSLISKIKLEQGAVATGWSAYATETQAKTIQITENRLLATGFGEIVTLGSVGSNDLETIMSAGRIQFWYKPSGGVLTKYSGFSTGVIFSDDDAVFDFGFETGDGVVLDNTKDFFILKDGVAAYRTKVTTTAADFRNNFYGGLKVNSGSLHIANDNDVAPTSTLHGLQVGLTSGANLRFDPNEIMAVNNGVATVLHLNAEGGDVKVSDLDPWGAAELYVRGNKVYHAGNIMYIPRIWSVDSRNENFSPQAYRGISLHLKGNTTDGLNDGYSFHGVLNLQQWDDTSGGKNIQLGFSDNGNVWKRSAADNATWGAWRIFQLMPPDQTFQYKITVVFGSVPHGSYYQASFIALPYANWYNITSVATYILDGTGDNIGAATVDQKSDLGFTVMHTNSRVAGKACFIHFSIAKPV